MGQASQQQFAQANAFTQAVMRDAPKAALITLVAGDEQSSGIMIDDPTLVHREVFEGKYPMLAFRHAIADWGDAFDLETASETEFTRLENQHGIVDRFMGGVRVHWYPVVVVQANPEGAEDYTPAIKADYNGALIHFTNGRMPSESGFLYLVASIIMQIRMVSETSSDARQCLIDGLRSKGEEGRQVLDARLRRIDEANRDLVEALVVLDPRLACYEGFDYELVGQVRSAMRMDELEVIAKEALSESRRLLADRNERLSRRQRTFTAVAVAVLAVVSALTSVLTVIDFAVASEDLTVQNALRLVEAVAFVGVAAILAIMIYRWNGTRSAEAP